MRVPDQLDVTSLGLRAYERTRVKRLWDQFRPYADANFAQELIGHFHERYWEMCLVYVILRRGMRLRERSMTGGPDISIQSEKGTIWVEATAPGPGTTADAVPQPELVDLDWLLLCEDPLELLQEIEESDEIASAPEEAIILRYRNALDEKLRKYSKYVKQPVISPTEPYVVAINGASVHPIFGAGAVIPIIAKAVLALGQLQFVFPQNLAGEPTKHIEVRYAVQKKSGSEVRTDIFLNESYSGMSGVLFSRCDLTTPLRHLGQDFVFVHNPGAINPLRHGWLRLGRECWMNENTLHIKSWSRSRKG